MTNAETKAQELSRLVTEFDFGERQNRNEAWNLIAEFAYDNAEEICELLERRASDKPSEAVAAYFAVQSAYGSHIGMWDRIEPARAAAEEYDGIIVPLFTSSEVGSGVTVKPLEWWDVPGGKRAAADAMCGRYRVEQPINADVWRWSLENGMFSDPYASRDEAKSAAQADYEQRILSTLTTQPAESAKSGDGVTDMERGMLDAITSRLVSLTVGTCSCSTMTPELKFHTATCRYRIAAEALELARPLTAALGDHRARTNQGVEK